MLQRGSKARGQLLLDQHPSLPSACAGPPAFFEDISHEIIRSLLSQVLLCISVEQRCNGSCHHLCQKRQEMKEKQLYEPGTAITSRQLLQFKSYYFAIDTKRKQKKTYIILGLWFRLKSKLFILKNTKRYYFEIKKGKPTLAQHYIHRSTHFLAKPR